MENRTILSKEEWGKFVSENSTISYSLVVCLCILSIWEAGCKDREEANKELLRCDFGISGAQADMAIDYAMKYQIDESLLDETMKKIKRDKDIAVTERVSEEKK